MVRINLYLIRKAYIIVIFQAFLAAVNHKEFIKQYPNQVHKMIYESFIYKIYIINMVVKSYSTS